MGSLSNIYLSLPVELKNRQAIVYEVCKKLDTYCDTTGDTVITDYYIPGQFYNPSLANKCDVFVFTDINMPWHITVDLLPSGVRRELKSAMLLRKPIYYIYRNKEGELNMYHCIYAPDTIQNIQPIAGTTTHLYHFLKELKEKKENNFPLKAILEVPVEFGKIGHIHQVDADVIITIHKGLDRRLLL